MAALFIRGARQLVTLRGPCPRRGAALSELSIIADGALLIIDGRIEEVGSSRRIENLGKARGADVLDCTGKVVLPGFVDSGARLYGSGSAASEAGDRRDGAALRSASFRTLRLANRRWTHLSAAGGVTAFEICSGYDLDPAAELKILRCAAALNEDPIETIPVVQLRSDARNRGALFARFQEAAARVRARGLPVGSWEFDADASAMRVQDARQVLDEARRAGLPARVRSAAKPGQAAVRLAVEFGARSAVGLERLEGADLELLAASDTAALILPGESFFEARRPAAPARRLVDRGAALAVGSAFDPNAGSTLSMPTVLALACRELGLTFEEGLAAATINSAYVTGRSDRLGSLEPGKQGDVAIYDCGDYREILRHPGMNLCWATVRKGRIIYQAPSPPRP